MLRRSVETWQPFFPSNMYVLFFSFLHVCISFNFVFLVLNKNSYSELQQVMGRSVREEF